jgi:hypothetical protein
MKLAKFSSIFEEPDAGNNALVASLASYGLLYSQLSSNLLNDEFNEIIDKHLEILDHDSLEVRIVAGENIALLLQERRDKFAEEGMEIDHVESLNEIYSKLEELARDSSKSIAKKERSTQKASFRDVLASVKSDMVPELELKFKKDTVKFEGWAKIRLLTALRDIIGEGLVRIP